MSKNSFLLHLELLFCLDRFTDQSNRLCTKDCPFKSSCASWSQIWKCDPRDASNTFCVNCLVIIFQILWLVVMWQCRRVGRRSFWIIDFFRHWQFLCKNPGVTFRKRLFFTENGFIYSFTNLHYYFALRNVTQGEGVSETITVCYLEVAEFKTMKNWVTLLMYEQLPWEIGNAVPCQLWYYSTRDGTERNSWVQVANLSPLTLNFVHFFVCFPEEIQLFSLGLVEAG